MVALCVTGWSPFPIYGAVSYNKHKNNTALYPFARHRFVAAAAAASHHSAAKLNTLIKDCVVIDAKGGNAAEYLGLDVVSHIYPVNDLDVNLLTWVGVYNVQRVVVEELMPHLHQCAIAVNADAAQSNKCKQGLVKSYWTLRSFLILKIVCKNSPNEI